MSVHQLHVGRISWLNYFGSSLLLLLLLHLGFVAGSFVLKTDELIVGGRGNRIDHTSITDLVQLISSDAIVLLHELELLNRNLLLDELAQLLLLRLILARFVPHGLVLILGLAFISGNFCCFLSLLRDFLLLLLASLLF